MDAIKNCLGEIFLRRMKMNLSRKVAAGTEMQSNFKCKWSWLMDAFDEALGSDMGVKCLTAFLTDKEDHIGGKVVDVALHSIKDILNKAHGTLEGKFKDDQGALVSTKHLKNVVKFGMAYNSDYLNLPPACAAIKAYLGKELQKTIHAA